MIRRAGPSRDSAVLADFLPDGHAASLLTDGRAVWLEAATRDPERLVVARWSLGAEAPTLVDLTAFALTADTFAEVEHRRAPDGPNLLPAPIALPARMAVGASRDPVPGVRISLLHAGPVSLALPTGDQDFDAIGLVAEAGGERRIQWLGRGVGVLALGPLGAAPARWRVAGRRLAAPFRFDP